MTDSIGYYAGLLRHTGAYQTNEIALNLEIDIVCMGIIEGMA